MDFKERQKGAAAAAAAAEVRGARLGEAENEKQSLFGSSFVFWRKSLSLLEIPVSTFRFNLPSCLRYTGPHFLFSLLSHRRPGVYGLLARTAKRTDAHSARASESYLLSRRTPEFSECI